MPLFLAHHSANKNFMIKIYFLTTGFVLASLCYAATQTVNVPPALDRWNTAFANATIETLSGKTGILLKSGFMYLKDVDFLDGTIEADVSFPQQRGFPGFAFRVQDEN